MQLSTNLVFTFPNAKALNNQLFLGYSLGNLTFDENNFVKEFRLFILHYMVCFLKNCLIIFRYIYAYPTGNKFVIYLNRSY